MWHDIYPVEMHAEIRLQELRRRQARCCIAHWCCTRRRQQALQRWLPRIYSSIEDLLPSLDLETPQLSPQVTR